MPTYLFKNKNTGEEKEEFMSISERDKFLADNPEYEQLVNGAPSIGFHMLTRKPDQGFRDKLKEIKRKHKYSNINTW